MCPSRKKMSRLIKTYSYTCKFVSKQYSSISTNFPVMFFVAYKNWVESTRGLSLQEISEHLLNKLSEEASHDSSVAIVVDKKRESATESKYCFLVDCKTEKKVLARIYFIENENSQNIMVTPTCLKNLSVLFNQDIDSVRKSNFIYQFCEDNYRPSFAMEAKVSGVQSKLLDLIPIMDMDHILGQYFEETKFLSKGSYFCIDIKRYLSLNNVHLLPLLKLESKVYFYVEEIKLQSNPDKLELDDADLQTEGKLISKLETRLSQTNSVKHTFPQESVLTNNSKNATTEPAFFSSNLNFFLNIHGRHQKLVDKLGPKSCLTFLLAAEAGSGYDVITHALAKRLGFTRLETMARDLVGDTSGASEALVKRAANNVGTSHHVLWVIQEVEVLVFDRDKKFDDRAFLAVQESLSELKQDVVVLGICKNMTKIDPRLASLFLHHREIASLTKDDRKEILDWHVEKQSIAMEEGIKLDKLAKVTSGFNFSDLKYLLDFALDSAYSLGKSVVSEECLDTALTMIQNSRSDSLGLAQVPSVKWDQVGGLADAKEELIQAIDSPIPGSFGRAGVLLYGPPGVGKTLLAKAVATECSLNFMSVKGPELLNMYVGQSEENVRQVFARAKEAQPCVVFFDELDSLAPNRGQSGDSGGVMDRVVSALLAELDRLETCQVTVIGATNRPDLVDPALLRPGRFDRLVYLGVTSDPSQQYLILKALTKKMNIDKDCDLEKLCPRLPEGLTGADLSSLVSEAALKAIKRTIEKIENGDEHCEAVVTFEDFSDALKDIKPSVSSQDLKNYENLRYSLRQN